jgi:putative ubiquitin-RnfH superfamily antitoxin RatB of RatAB toxin-antitoxin module
MAIRVNVVYSPAPREVCEVALQLEEGASAAQALRARGLLNRFAELAGGPLMVGVWGRKATPKQALRDQDRVEIYRPLKVDPKVARRTRFVKQGARAAGLFARKRPGAKAGY